MNSTFAACPVPAATGVFRVVATHQLATGEPGDSAGLCYVRLPKLVREVVARAGIGTDDIDWVVPPDAGAAAWRIVGKLLGIPMDRLWQNSTGVLRPGQRVLLVMAGHELPWRATILEVAELLPVCAPAGVCLSTGPDKCLPRGLPAVCICVTDEPEGSI
ncbi:hypothetical protein [Crossiella cryophila]|uniref:Uncharacterized protein n=1 Tax=Crossiella cryophila TaxID=43355 RepID=A0A7W7CCD2_9PSEU|nr:hypothetical protein [Crossiella cryophila]MBB4678567.1 hypothetical protein [Crossiella cryophila]